MTGKGPKGLFANLKCKHQHEIPMAVLLPPGGPVRPTISGTDCDGIREVDGITAIYETKAWGANNMPEGQFRALKSLGDFFVTSVWFYNEIDENIPPKSENEELARASGYTRTAVPHSAVVYANKPEAKKWLYRYLVDCGFNVNSVSGGEAFQFPGAYDAQATHIFRPTKAWLCIAYLPDYYAQFIKRGNYCHPTCPPFVPES